MEPPSTHARIDAYVAASRAMNGLEMQEREPWNTRADAEAIRHFAYGTGDDNPLWLDAVYAAASPYGRRAAPPAFLASVCYPGLHGAPMAVPLTSLIGSLEYIWEKPVLEGDRLYARARQTDVFDTEDRTARRMVFVLSEVTYYRDPEEVVARARCSMVRPFQPDAGLAVERPVYRYGEAERAEIARHLTGYVRTGSRRLHRDEVAAGQPLPLRVIPPLTIGDLIGWQAAIGPSYRSGVLGFRDGLAAPHSLLTHPITGWQVKYSQGHEDPHLAALRGMPGPFDNSVMRFAYVASILTDWMGDHGFLQRLQLHTQAPVLYGDATWYRSTIRHTRETDGSTVVAIEITGANQLGETTTTGAADVVLPQPAPPPPRRVAASGNQTFLAGARVPYPDGCAHTLFERQAEAVPDATAVVFREHRLTYRHLNDQAEHIAATLQQAGIGRGTLVGVCAERSVAYVALVLGILKAGGGFMPLDPSHPPARLAALLADAGATVVLAQRAFRALLPAQHPVIAVEDLTPEAHDAPTRAVAEADPADRAYVLYTSGSTGTPKGVSVSHRSLSRYLQSIRAPLGIRADDVYLHSASFTFSASIRQLLLPLTVGATLVVADIDQRHDPVQLFALMRAQGVTVWDTVPSFWRYCLSIPSLQTDPTLVPEALRLILTTGEPLPWDLPQTWHGTWRHPAEVVNLYSQTETVGTISYYRVPEPVPKHVGFVPLGGPVENTRLYVLDAALGQRRPGETGELWVGGDRLSDGYLHSPSLTSERFVPDPFDERPGARMYRTGDLVRLAPANVLEWVGRADRLVKIRGHRVEPAEVEAILAAHPGVREAAVLMQPDGDGDPTLAAYIVPAAPEPPTVAALRHFAEERLPLFMVPATFTVLEALPRTASGKLDRRALPAPVTDVSPGAGYAAPQTSLENALAEVWAIVLRRPRVGRSDNFFELGGHSLHAVSILTQVRERLAMHVPLRLFFDAPTVAEMAAVLEMDQQADDDVGHLMRELDRLPPSEREAVLRRLSSPP